MELPTTTINRHYDRTMYGRLSYEWYGGSDFCNYGYWEPGAQTATQASENLMERLLAFIPRKDGTILDVACGMGRQRGTS